jgi:predicted dehydrogenase
MSGTRALRAAIIGAGLMGRWHAEAVARIGGRVSWIVDPQLPRARALAAKHDGARAGTTLADALAVSDIVHVCAPVDAHENIVREAIAAGRHALVEKPLAATAATVRRLLDEARMAGVLVCPVHQFLFQRGTVRLLALRDSLGAIRHVDFVACSAGAEGRNAPSADAVVADILPHPLSLTARLLVAPLAEAAWRVQRPRPGELRATATLAGASVSMLISMSGRPTTNECRVTAEGGTVHLDLFHGFAVVERRAEGTRLNKVLHPFSRNMSALAIAGVNLAGRALRRETAYPGLGELVRQAHTAASSGGPPPITPTETIAVAEARDRILA